MSEKKEVFSCIVCGMAFDSLVDAKEHISTIHSTLLGEGNFEPFIETFSVELSTKKDPEKLATTTSNLPAQTTVKEPTTEGTIEESPEEHPIETDEEYQEEEKRTLDVESKEDREEVIELGLKAKSKAMTHATPDLVKKYLKRFSKVTDESNFICPICGIDLLAKAGLESQKLSKSASFEKLSHVRKVHPLWFKLWKNIYEVEKTPAGTEGKESWSGPLMDHQKGTPNPEQCHKTEDLSRDFSKEFNDKVYVENLSKKIEEFGSSSLSQAEKTRFLRILTRLKRSRK